MLEKSYMGLRPTDPGGRCGLPNPERGWRIETFIAEDKGLGKNLSCHGTAHHLAGKIPPVYSEQWWILDARRYEHYGLRIAQTYCYLDPFIGKPLTDEKLALLQKSLDNLRKQGMKALLRFAYEKSSAKQPGPSVADILRHLDQLAPVIRANVDVIYVMQAGFVGAWGEWHNSTHGIENDHGALAAIVARILEILPADRMIQVRVPKYKRWVLEQPALGGHRVVTAETAHTPAPCARIGIYNDGFLASRSCGNTWLEPPYYSNPGNPEFDYMTAECPYVPVDGELYWYDAEGKIDGLKAIARMRLHHYTTFSIWHSFSGREGRFYTIDEWMRTPLTEREIFEGQLPLAPDYFLDAFNNTADRTPFEYITDHLGYRFELQKACWPDPIPPGGALDVDLEIVNRGFAAMVNPRPVFVTLMDDDRCVAQFPIDSAKPHHWQPFEPGDPSCKPLRHPIRLRAKLPADLAAGWYHLGLWMPDASGSLRKDSRYAVRLANRDTPWWTDANGQYGVNLFGLIQVT